MPSGSLGHRAPLLWLVIPWITGLILGACFHSTTNLQTIFGCGVLLLGLGTCAGNRRFLWSLSIVGAGICSGFASYQIHQTQPVDWSHLPTREAHMQVKVLRMFSDRDSYNQSSGLGEVVSVAPHLHALLGQRIYFSAQLDDLRAIATRNTRFSLTGILSSVPSDETGQREFYAFLKSNDNRFMLRRAFVSGNTLPSDWFHLMCHHLRQRFGAILETGLAERPDLAALLKAMMLGQKQELSSDQNELFMHSGTMHLFAISGLHIGVIALSLDCILGLLRLSGLIRFVLGSLLLAWFVAIIGAPPSAVRALFMAVMLNASWRLRVPGNPIAALSASALLVLFLYPEQLFTTSFQMSYAIVFSLLLFSLPMSDRWQKRLALWRDLPEATWSRSQRILAKAWDWFIVVFWMGIGATLASTLAGVESFGQVTPVSFPANLILIPMAGLTLVGGVLSLLFGCAGFLSASSLFNHASGLLLHWMQQIVQWISQIPGSFLPARFPSPAYGSASLAMLLCLIMIGYSKRWKGLGGQWWIPPAWVMATLVFVVKFT